MTMTTEEFVAMMNKVVRKSMNQGAYWGGGGASMDDDDYGDHMDCDDVAAAFGVDFNMFDGFRVKV